MAKTKIRLLIFLIVLTALSSAIEWAFAHIPCMCDNPPDQCTCFIQLGDKGFAVKKIIEVLKEKGYLVKTQKNDEFTVEVKQAVIQFQIDHDLECTGWMDDETLTLLLFDRLPDPTVLYTEKLWNNVCFVPTDGGIRYHTNPTCSDMYYPRLITRMNAEKLGIKHCRKEYSCPKDSGIQAQIQYSSLRLTPRLLPDEYYVEDKGLTFEEVTADTSTVRSLLLADIDTVYIGNKKSRIFHLASCNSVKDMSEKNKIEFLTRNEAIEKGYKPCNRCKP